ncbi:MAG: hypothetical protein KDC27_21530 [Acidobacteria bacterium]|nr:hypothetical protein [Acidobacteriota bacterium]
MPAHNGSNGGSNGGANGGPRSFEEISEELFEQSRAIQDLAESALAAPDDARKIAEAERLLDGFFEADESKAASILTSALEVDPGCVEALTITARALDDPTDASILLEAAVQVAERRLGDKMFEQMKGKFWDIQQTRPYMRALLALAESQMDEMDYGAGLDSYCRLLELSDRDALHVRFTLTSALLAADQVERAREIAFDRFGDDDAPSLLWSRTLILYLERDFDGAAAMLERAREACPGVELYLLGELELAEEAPEPDSTLPADVADLAARDQMVGWRSRPLSLIWLKVGGKPGDDRYFGALTDPDLDLLGGFEDDDELFDDDFDDLEDEDDEPYLLN